MQQGRVRRGFSLMEVLVVISTAALLLGITLPSLNTARQQARKAACLDNLRQMAIAAHNYCSVNDEFYPLAYYTERQNNVRSYYAWDFTYRKHWGASPPTERIEPGLLWMGLTIEKVHQCPAFKGPANWFEDPYTGYNYNTSYIGRDETVGYLGSARTTDVRHPSQTAIFGDGQYAGGANKFMRAPFSNPRDASFSDSFRHAGTQGYRHLRQTNVAFCDAHAQSWQDIHTETDPAGQRILDEYNQTNTVQVGFLTPDNGIYDLN